MDCDNCFEVDQDDPDLQRRAPAADRKLCCPSICACQSTPISGYGRVGVVYPSQIPLSRNERTSFILPVRCFRPHSLDDSS